MTHAENADEKYARMTQTPVRKLVCTLAGPTIISMLITSVYNMADTFFVGKIGTSATAAVGIAFSVMSMIQAIGFTLGIGSGNYTARLLGKKDGEYAAKVVSTGFFTTLGIGLLLTIVGLLFLDPLVHMLGATPTISPYAKSYIGYILLGAPYMAASLLLNNILRFQGSTFYAMIGICTGGILNVALDPLFIFYFGMGTGGAALATIISQFISFCVLLYYSGRNGNIKISFLNFTPDWKIYREILRGGMPSFYRQGLASVSTICLNVSAGVFGDAAIAGMSIATRVLQFAISIMFGFGHGFQPVCGFNYGARRYDRVLEAFWFCVKVSAVGLVLMGGAGFVFAPQIISAFRKEDLDVIRIGTAALRFQCVTFPLSSWIVISNMLLQTIGKGTKASILAMARQGLFFLPTIFILPPLLQLTGVQLSQPVADVFAFCLAVPLGMSVVKELRAAQIEEGKLS